jgi:hypothetical protein
MGNWPRFVVISWPVVPESASFTIPREKAPSRAGVTPIDTAMSNAVPPHKSYFDLVTYLGTMPRVANVLRPVMTRHRISEVDGPLSSARLLDRAGVSPVEVLSELTDDELRTLAMAWCGAVVGRGSGGTRHELIMDLTRAVQTGGCD